MNGPENNQLFEDLSPEERAYIYQKMQDFQPYLGEESQVLVQVTKVEGGEEIEASQSAEVAAPGPSSPESFIAQVKISSDVGEIEVKGSADNFYSAVSKAHEALMKVVEQIHDEVTTLTDREVELMDAKYFSTMH